jgi:Tetratricopeptide repeat
VRPEPIAVAVENAVRRRHATWRANDEHAALSKKVPLAGLLLNQDDIARARRLCERALAIREQALGPEHRDTATSLDSLAALLEEQRDFAGHGRSTSARWPYAKRCSALSISARRRASTTSPSYSRTRATLQQRDPSVSAHWQAPKSWGEE